eukprot:5134861-Pyramimonas_sp.AAC.1
MCIRDRFVTFLCLASPTPRANSCECASHILDSRLWCRFPGRARVCACWIQTRMRNLRAGVLGRLMGLLLQSWAF